MEHLIGNKYHKLTVIDTTKEKDKTGKTMVVCKCECGNILNITVNNLKSGNTKSCGCNKHRRRFMDISGKTFNQLTVVCLDHIDSKSICFWKCKCTCGKEVIVRGGHLCNGHTKSCGHIIKETEYAKTRLVAGKNHAAYKNGISQEYRSKTRHLPENTEFRKFVFKRDKYRCCICGKKGKLNVHHLFGYRDYPELRFDTNNGVTLCEKCHKYFHKMYGNKNVTEEDFYKCFNLPYPGVVYPCQLDGNLLTVFNCISKTINEKSTNITIEDLQKAVWYLQDEIKMLQEKQ